MDNLSSEEQSACRTIICFMIYCERLSKTGTIFYTHQNMLHKKRDMLLLSRGGYLGCRVYPGGTATQDPLPGRGFGSRSTLKDFPGIH